MLSGRMFRHYCFSVLAFFSVFLWIVTASAENTDQELFVLGNIEFVVLHELAHVLIHDLEIPILGPEENAADYIATLALVRPQRFGEPQADRARAFTAAAAQGFVGAWEAGQPMVNSLPYWDDHLLTIQRFYQISCLLYGSNPERFPQLLERIGMPSARAKQCKMIFKKADSAVQWLFDNYARETEKPHEMQIYYSTPDTLAGRKILAALAESKLIENALSRLQSRFELDAPIVLNVQNCGKVQAAWDVETRILTICHELFDHYYVMAKQKGVTNRMRVFKESTGTNH